MNSKYHQVSPVGPHGSLIIPGMHSKYIAGEYTKKGSAFSPSRARDRSLCLVCFIENNRLDSKEDLAVSKSYMERGDLSPLQLLNQILITALINLIKWTISV